MTPLIEAKESKRRISGIFGDKVLIDWFSGNISLPKAKILRWNRVFHISFEEEILFQVNNGKTQNISVIEVLVT